MDLVRSRGAAAFGTRLRRLSERLDREVQTLYAERGLPFEPRWFSVVLALREAGPLTVGELASRLGVSHAAVSQVRAAMTRAGLVAGDDDPADRRRRTLRLTEDGEAVALRCEPLWDAIRRTTDSMLAAHAPELLSQMDALEAALDDAGLKARVDRISPPGSGEPANHGGKP